MLIQIKDLITASIELGKDHQPLQTLHRNCYYIVAIVKRKKGRKQNKNNCFIYKCEIIIRSICYIRDHEIILENT